MSASIWRKTTFSRRPGSGGFTLIELLVVIGMIALLLSILLPVLGKARDAAKGAGCSNNVRQLVVAFLGFAHDHKGRLPGNYWDGANPERDKRSWLNNFNEPWTKAPESGTIFKYLKDATVYRCPAQSFEVVGSGGGSNGRFDYSAIPAFTGAYLSQISLEATFAHPDGRNEDAFTPIVIEEDPAVSINRAYLDGAHCAGDRISPVHRGGGYYATADGSVQWMLQDPQGSSMHWLTKTPGGKLFPLGSSDGKEGWGWWANR